MTYDFREMTEPDLFKARLANKVIDFGYIPMWRLRAFMKFCVKHRLIYQPDGYSHHSYKVEHEYKYICTGSKVSFLPFGWAFVLWHDIVGYKDLSGSHPAQNDFIYSSNIHVRPHGIRPRFDYVIYSEGIVF